MHSFARSMTIFKPLQSLWQWLMASPGEAPQLAPAFASTATPALRCTPAIRNTTVQAHCRFVSPVSVRRPLRMVRVLETGQTPSQVGRMVISGRMADVCAELDRLAAFESPAH